jgi:hypothetical protein
MLSLPPPATAHNAWNHAAGLAIETREDPCPAALEEFTRQFERALFVTWRMDLSIDRRGSRKPSALRRGGKQIGRKTRVTGLLVSPRRWGKL